MKETGLSFLAAQHRNQKWREDKARWTIPAVFNTDTSEKLLVLFMFLH